LEDPSSLEDGVVKMNEQNYYSDIMGRVVNTLPPDERSIIQERFFSEKPKTLRDLAKEMKISREWVRKLEIKALDRIRKRLATQYDIRSF
jgi:RNA polymerase sigma-32 factor